MAFCENETLPLLVENQRAAEAKYKEAVIL